MTALLDGSLLVALGVTDHIYHEAAHGWLGASKRRYATTPITQGTLLRMLLRIDVAADRALTVLSGITADPRHEFWPDDRPYDTAALRGVIGHRQVTDGYLAGLARARRGRLATFDRGLAVAHADIVELVET